MIRKEKAQAIRKNLKAAHGYTARQVSISCSRGSAINITIKCPLVKKHLVEAAAKGYESIDRCKFSGEILSGGNTFIFVSYARELLEARAAELLPLLSDEAGKSVEVEGFEIWRTNDRTRPNSDEYCICKAGGNLNSNLRPHGKTFAAQSLAAVIFDGGFEYCGQWIN